MINHQDMLVPTTSQHCCGLAHTQARGWFYCSEICHLTSVVLGWATWQHCGLTWHCSSGKETSRVSLYGGYPGVMLCTLDREYMTSDRLRTVVHSVPEWIRNGRGIITEYRLPMPVESRVPSWTSLPFYQEVSDGRSKDANAVTWHAAPARKGHHTRTTPFSSLSGSLSLQRRLTSKSRYSRPSTAAALAPSRPGSASAPICAGGLPRRQNNDRELCQTPGTPSSTLHWHNCRNCRLGHVFPCPLVRSSRCG